MKVSVRLFEIEDRFIASCPELEINCYGSDKAEAARRINEVLNFYLKSAEELGLDVEKFDNISIDGLDFPFINKDYHIAPATIN